MCNTKRANDRTLISKKYVNDKVHYHGAHDSNASVTQVIYDKKWKKFVVDLGTINTFLASPYPFVQSRQFFHRNLTSGCGLTSKTKLFIWCRGSRSKYYFLMEGLRSEFFFQFKEIMAKLCLQFKEIMAKIGQGSGVTENRKCIKVAPKACYCLHRYVLAWVSFRWIASGFAENPKWSKMTFT